MQRTIKFALAAAIYSVQANAIAVERRGGRGGRGDRGDRGERLSCEEATTQLLDRMTERCADDETCLGIVSDLEGDLDGGCPDIDVAQEALRALMAPRKELVCVAKCEIKGEEADCAAKCDPDAEDDTA